MAPHSVAHEHATCSGWLAREEPEWAYAWSYFPDPGMAHPASGECLQYMGSAQYPGRGWVHVFRHRQVPGSDRRQYWQVPASVGWQAGAAAAGVSPPSGGARACTEQP